MNGRPISMRKKVQLMVALTLLAWATQTLFHQWGFGQGVAASPQEKFVLGTARFADPAAPEQIVDGLAKYCARKKVEKLASVVGTFKP